MCGEDPVASNAGQTKEAQREIDAVADVRAPGDFNGDDRVDALDLAAFLAGWDGPPRFDLNRDGSVDSIDLATVLANWG